MWMGNTVKKLRKEIANDREITPVRDLSIL